LKEAAGLKAKRPCRFPHHMDHLHARQCNGCRREGLETRHGSHPALDAPMILPDPAVEVLALAMLIGFSARRDLSRKRLPAS